MSMITNSCMIGDGKCRLLFLIPKLNKTFLLCNIEQEMARYDALYNHGDYSNPNSYYYPYLNGEILQNSPGSCMAICKYVRIRGD